MQQEAKYDRRRFAAMSVAAAKFVATNSAHVESGRTKASSATAIKPPANPLFGSLKQIDFRQRADHIRALKRTGATIRGGVQRTAVEDTI
jgi:hypothetical protein